MAIATRSGVGGLARRPRREHWRALLEAQRRSGLSLAAFCRQRGVRTGTLSFWKWKLTHEAARGRRAAAADGRTAPTRFVPVQLAAHSTAPAPAAPAALRDVEIALATGRQVRIRVDLAELAAVLRAVEALGC